MPVKPIPKPTPERIEIFAGAIARGETQSDAYRLMHPNCLKWKGKAINSKASIWANHDIVLGRVAEMRQIISKKTQITMETISMGYKAAYDLAMNGTYMETTVTTVDGEGNEKTRTKQIPVPPSANAASAAMKGLAQLYGLEAPKRTEFEIGDKTRMWIEAERLPQAQIDQLGRLLQDGVPIELALPRVKSDSAAIMDLDIR